MGGGEVDTPLLDPRVVLTHHPVTNDLGEERLVMASGEGNGFGGSLTVATR